MYDTDPISSKTLEWMPLAFRRCGCRGETFGYIGAGFDGYFVIECKDCRATWAWVIEAGRSKP